MDSDEKDVKTSSQNDEDIKTCEVSPLVDTKRMFRKVDIVVLMIMLVTYALQFTDKLALSSAAVFGLRTELKLVGQDYSWTSSVFYFGYMLGNFLVAKLIHVFPIGKFIFFTVCAWGITLACTAACTNYAGLITARFFLGLLESAVSPTFVFMTTMWYTQEQRAFRGSVWFAGNDVGGVFSALVCFGLGHAGGALLPWKYIFITFGCLTFLWSFVILFFLPDTPQKATFLTADEKQFYHDEMKASDVEKEWDWDQAKSCVFDLNLWLILLSTAMSILPNSGVISYGYIILDSFGFTSIQSTLINLALSVLTFFCITISGYFASRLPNARCYMVLVCVAISIVGGCLIYKGNSKGVKLLGYFLVDAQPAITPLLLGMAASNFQGNTRRSVVNSSIFVVYCACNIAGPQLFQSTDAPHYPHAFLAWIICYCLNAVFAVAMRFRWIQCNKKMEKLSQIPETDGKEVIEFLDPTFRYKY